MDKDEFAKSFNHFHFRAFKQILSSNDNKTVIFSPFLLHLALTKLYLCSCEKTSTELSDTLNYDPKLSKRDPARNVRTLLSIISKDRYTCFSEKLLINESFTLNENINQRLEKYFGEGSGIYRVNFLKQEKARRKINALVESDTSHVVQSIAKDDFATGSCAIMTQVMVFKGQWEKGFNQEDVKMHPFWINKKEMTQVEMMSARNKFKYGKIKEWKTSVVELNFYKSDLSFVILLPDSKTGLKNLESKICGKGNEIVFSKIDERLIAKGVNLAIPKLLLEIDYFDMEKYLKKLGIVSLFDHKKCNLSEAISESLDASFYISKVVHKSILKLKTNGKNVPANPMLFDMNTPNFMVDHPFMFFLRVKNTPICIFSGSIRKIEGSLPNVNPQQQFGMPTPPPGMVRPGPYMPLMRHAMPPPPLTPQMGMQFPPQSGGAYVRMQPPPY